TASPNHSSSPVLPLPLERASQPRRQKSKLQCTLQQSEPTQPPHAPRILLVPRSRSASASPTTPRRRCAPGDPEGRRGPMRCKLHPYANALGVCAPCLRDRLLVLAADSPARGRAASPFAAAAAPAQQHRRSDACAYTSSRHSHSHRPELLFFSTPQVGPATRAADDEPRESERKKSFHRRRSFLAALFGGGRRGGREEESESKKDPPRRSTSWLSAIVRRKRRPDASSSSSLPRPVDEEPESPGGSTSSSWWFPSPSPARHHHHPQRRSRPGGSGASGDGISGFAVCLSPLVRPSSGGPRRRCQQPDPSTLGESHRRHLSASSAASFGRNTSRKLADMGRFR
uniref:Uncharacterized protein n=1 Tax=Aegilops tauschii subsp. strangulata TaxID=200361 RepID=A0A452YUY9_AEGTS